MAGKRAAMAVKKTSRTLPTWLNPFFLILIISQLARSCAGSRWIFRYLCSFLMFFTSIQAIFEHTHHSGAHHATIPIHTNNRINKIYDFYHLNFFVPLFGSRTEREMSVSLFARFFKCEIPNSIQYHRRYYLHLEMQPIFRMRIAGLSIYNTFFLIIMSPRPCGLNNLPLFYHFHFSSLRSHMPTTFRCICTFPPSEQMCFSLARSNFSTFRCVCVIEAILFLHSWAFTQKLSLFQFRKYWKMFVIAIVSQRHFCVPTTISPAPCDNW